MAGVNWNREWAQLVLVRVGSEGGASDGNLIKGIEALPWDTAVANISLAGHGQPADPLCLAIAAKPHILFVIAAGNIDSGENATDPEFPANCPSRNNIISVASTKQGDQLADRSKRGYWVDVAAPGENIVVAAGVIASGTSFAAPHVAGAASLIYATRSAAALNPAAVKAQILGGSDYKGLEVLSGGRLNAFNALVLP
jgi:subtilisin family serine protease